MLTAYHHSAIPTGSIPEWVHLVPGGTFSGTDGRGPYILGNPSAVARASMAQQRLPVDENHSTDLAAPKGAPSPAQGWIVQMQPRADGLWGKVEWTAAGRALLAQRAYRFISPAFTYDTRGNVLQLLRAALTNTPNLPRLTALHVQGAGLVTDVQPPPADAELMKLLTPGDHEIARRMGIEPKALALQKWGRLRADQRAAAFEQATTARNPMLARGRQATHAQQSTEDAELLKELRPADREVCRRMGISLKAMALLIRNRKEGKDMFGRPGGQQAA